MCNPAAGIGLAVQGVQTVAGIGQANADFRAQSQAFQANQNAILEEYKINQQQQALRWEQEDMVTAQELFMHTLQEDRDLASAQIAGGHLGDRYVRLLQNDLKMQNGRARAVEEINYDWIGRQRALDKKSLAAQTNSRLAGLQAPQRPNHLNAVAGFGGRALGVAADNGVFGGFG